MATTTEPQSQQEESSMLGSGKIDSFQPFLIFKTSWLPTQVSRKLIDFGLQNGIRGIFLQAE